MLRFLFDTDHLTLFQHQLPILMYHMAAHPPDAVGISPVSIEETLRGRLAVLARPLVGTAHIQAYSHLVSSLDLFRLLQILPFDQACEARFQQLRTSRVRVGSRDLKIAAIALANNLTVLSRNRQDFARIPSVMLDDWSV